MLHRQDLYPARSIRSALGWASVGHGSGSCPTVAHALCLKGRLVGDGGREGGQQGQGLSRRLPALGLPGSGCVPLPDGGCSHQVPFFYTFLSPHPGKPGAPLSLALSCLPGASLYLTYFVKASLLIPPQIT